MAGDLNEIRKWTERARAQLGAVDVPDGSANLIPTVVPAMEAFAGAPTAPTAPAPSFMHRELARTAEDRFGNPSMGLGARDILPLALATGGGALVGEAGIAAGATAAGLGGGLGEFFNQVIDAARGKQTEGLPGVLKAAGVNAAGEGIGRGMVAGLEKVLSPASRTVLTEALPAANTLRATHSENMPQTLRDRMGVGGTKRTAAVFPYEINASPFVQWLKRVAVNDRIGRDVLLRADQQRIDSTVLHSYAHAMDAAGAHLSDQEMAELLVNEFRGNRDLARFPANQIYDALDDLSRGGIAHTAPPNAGPGTTAIGQTFHTGGIDVNYDNVKRRVLPILDDYTRPTASTGDSTLDSQIRRMAMEPNAERNFTDVRNERTRLRTIIRNAEVSIDNKNTLDNVRRVGEQLDRALTTELHRSLDDYQPGLSGWLRTADQIWAGTTEQYSPLGIRRLMHLTHDNAPGHAENIVDRIFGRPGGQPPMGPQAINEIRRALTVPEGYPNAGEAPGWETLKGWYVRNGLLKSIDSRTGQLDGDVLMKWLNDQEKGGVLRSVLHDRGPTIDALRTIADNARFIESGGKTARNPRLSPTFSIGVTPQGGVGIKVSTGSFVGAGIGSSLGLASSLATGNPYGTFMGGAAGSALGAGAALGSQYFLGGPFASKVAARLLTNETSARWLAEGFRGNLMTRARAGTLGRVLAEAANEEKIADYEERVRQKLIAKGKAAVGVVSDALTPEPTE